MTRHRAVSDALGFAIVFAIVVGSVALVYTFGVASIADLQQAQQDENVERGFQTLADNVNDVHREGAPGRSTELALSGGQLSTTETVTFVVNVTGDGDPAERVRITPITYRRGPTSIHYVSGTVFRSDRGATVRQSSLPFRFDEERTVLSLVRTRSTAGASGQSVGGDGTLLVLTRRSGPPTATRLGEDVTFNLSVTSPRYRAWNRSLAAQGLDFEAVDEANETVTYSYETDELYLRTTAVGVELKP